MTPVATTHSLLWSSISTCLPINELLSRRELKSILYVYIFNTHQLESQLASILDLRLGDLNLRDGLSWGERHGFGECAYPTNLTYMKLANRYCREGEVRYKHQRTGEICR